MVTYILDASAVLRYVDDEAGSHRISEIIKLHLAGRCRAIISAVHWGEIAGVVRRFQGVPAMELIMTRLESFGIEVAPVSGDRAVRASLIKFSRKIPYVDAFGVELAGDSSEHVLVTADFDLKPASRDVKIEFLPSK
jgi:predicted nucleic acid-binding protein